MDYYRFEIVSSEYRYKNKFLFANRITAFNLWRQIDTKKNGYLSFPAFQDLLSACAFDDYNSKDDFYKDIETSLKFLPKEKDLGVFRFRLFETLFLERCAL